MYKYILCLVMSLIMISCDIDQTKKGKLPEVDVAVTTESGQLPSYDVEWADVNVGTKTQTVKVPKVVVVMEEVEVEVPYMDIDMPDDGSVKEERTLEVAAEVQTESHQIKIVEVYAKNKKLYVVSKLVPLGQDLKGQKLRVSDRLIINASDDLDVKHYIIGKRPAGEFNKQFSYINNRNAIANKLSKDKSIYKSKNS